MWLISCNVLSHCLFVGNYNVARARPLGKESGIEQAKDDMMQNSAASFFFSYYVIIIYFFPHFSSVICTSGAALTSEL